MIGATTRFIIVESKKTEREELTISEKPRDEPKSNPSRGKWESSRLCKMMKKEKVARKILRRKIAVGGVISAGRKI
jgi:hypothetical protein